MTSFAAALAIADVATDALYGEVVEWRPQLSGAAAEYVDGGADPARPVRTVTGIFDDDAVLVRTVGSGANTHENVDVLAGKSQIDLALNQFSTPAGLPVQGDLIALVSQPGTPIHQIVSAEPDEYGRLICLLTKRGS